MDPRYQEIRDIILRAAPAAGIHGCALNALSLVRRDQTTDFLKCFYCSSCLFVLQGRKQLLFGNDNLIYGPGEYVVASADVPVSSRVAEASPEKPFLALSLKLDRAAIADLIIEARLPALSPDSKALAVARADDNLSDAFCRLARLIGAPRDALLAPMIVREIYYRLLTGPAGDQLALTNTSGTHSHQIASAIEYLKANFTAKLSIDSLAAYVHMSPSSFYRNFRNVTRASPLQYLKQLRLTEARSLLLSGRHNVESASYSVGYESPAQFCREYKKMFGSPPASSARKPLPAG